MAETNGYPYPPFVVEKESSDNSMNSMWPWLLLAGGNGFGGFGNRGGYGNGYGNDFGGGYGRGFGGGYGYGCNPCGVNWQKSPQDQEVAEREFDAIQNQINGLSAQVEGVKGAAQHAEITAALASIKDLNVTLANAAALGDCEKFAAITKAISDCCCMTSKMVGEVNSNVTMQAMGVKSDLCNTNTLIHNATCDVRHDICEVRHDICDLKRDVCDINRTVDGSTAEIKNALLFNHNAFVQSIERTRDDILDSIKNDRISELQERYNASQNEVSDLKQTCELKTKIDAAIATIVTHVASITGGQGGHGGGGH